MSTLPSWLRWLGDVTAKTIVGGILGSASVTAGLNYLVRMYSTLSWEAAWILWTLTPLVSFVVITKWAARRSAPTKQLEAESPKAPAYPVVNIRVHRTGNRDLGDQIERLFTRSEYTVDRRDTADGSPSIGIAVRWGRANEQSHAVLALGTLGVPPEHVSVGNTDRQKSLEVTIGAYELPPSLGEQLNLLRKELEAVTRSRDQAIDALKVVQPVVVLPEPSQGLSGFSRRMQRMNELQHAEQVGAAFVRGTVQVGEKLQTTGVKVEWRKTDSHLMVSVTNTGLEPIEEFRIWVDEPRWFSSPTGKFARTRDFQDYRRLQLTGGTNRLYHLQPEHFPFLNYAAETLYFTGSAPGNPAGKGTFRTTGIWRVTFRTEVGNVTENHQLCFSWSKSTRTIPDPCDCPPVL